MTTMTISAQEARFGAGMVLAMRERNGYSDSDFEALFATKNDDGTYTFGWTETGTTRFADGGGNFVAHADATDEVKAAYREARAGVMAQMAAARADTAVRRVRVGKMVRVVKAVTRGKNRIGAGFAGEVFWRGVDQYKTSRWGTYYRVGIRLANGQRVFLAEENVRVVGFEDEALPMEINMDWVGFAAWPEI